MHFSLRWAGGMRSTFGAVGAVATIFAVSAAVAVSPAAASRGCGTLPGGVAPRRVTILRGPVSCTQARAAAKDYIAGRGSFHGPASGPRAAQYVTLSGGWRCSVIEQGGAVCARDGSRRDPREQIAFVLD